VTEQNIFKYLLKITTVQ